jgi:hypothetical protein
VSERLAEAFDICLQAMMTGASLESCLRLYPELAADLRPALEAAVLLHQPEVVAEPAAVIRSRNRMLAQAAQARTRRRRAAISRPLPRMAFALAALLVAFTAGWGGLTTAAAQSLPGETLYPVKRAQEVIQLQMVRDSQERKELERAYNGRREAEARELLRLGRMGPVTFEGVVENLEASYWQISGLAIALSDQTVVEGIVKPGDSVIVTGTTRPEGDILASKVRLHTYQLRGTVDQLAPGAWTIAGRPLMLLPSTQIQPDIQVGDAVLTLVEVSETGAHVARVILALGPIYLPGQDSTSALGSESIPSTPAAGEGGSDSEAVRFIGKVTSHQGSSWVVAGRTLFQTDQSEVRGDPQVGDTARVRALATPGGGLILLRIEMVEGPADGEQDDGEQDKDEQDGKSEDDEKSGSENSGPGSKDDDEPDDDESS